MMKRIAAAAGIVAAAVLTGACSTAHNASAQTSTAAAQTAQTQSPQTPTDALTGTILVANQQGASASLVDLATGRVTNLDVGIGPHEAAISHDGRTGAISLYGIRPAGNRIAIIDLAAGTITKTIDLGAFTRPHGMAFLPGDTKLLATSEATASVVHVDIPTGTVDYALGTRAAGSHMLALADTNRVFTANVGDGSISEIDLLRGTFVATYPIGEQTEGIAITPDGRFLWIGSNTSGTVTIFDTDSHTIVATLPDMGMPYRLAISPDGTTALICDPQGGRIIVVDTQSRTVTGTIPMEGAPEGIAIAPDSRTAFITLNKANAVAVIDIAARRELKRFTVGAAPDGVAYSAR
jgi:YVTN family beta-propeller protein